MNKIEFGTDGWRAIIDEDFNFENVKVVAQAIADYINSIKDKKELRNKEVIVGYDPRKNSEGYANAVASVLAGNGIKVLLVDRVTSTPALSFAIKKQNLTGGVMITASHNPPRYNGIKYKAYYSGSADTDITKRIEENLYKNKTRYISIEEAKDKDLLKMDNVIPQQLDFIKGYVDMELLKRATFKVLIDSMYGAGGRYLEDILINTNCKAITIHDKRDINFGGINPEPVAQNLAELIRRTKEENFDIGIATDGDMDRLGCVSPDGRMVNGQYLMSLLLWHFVEDKRMKGSVVTTVCGTVMLKKICQRYGLRLHVTPVGFKYICDVMRREDVLIGGEETGGIGFKDYIPERDGILSALLLLEMMAYRKRSLLDILADLQKEFGSYYYLRASIEYPEKKKDLLSNLKKGPPSLILDKKVVGTDTLDGIKFLCQDTSWLLFRPSGTEPILRIYSEGKSEEEAQAILEFGKRLVSKI